MAEAMTRSEERQKRLIALVDSDSAHRYFTSIVLQRLDYNIHTMNSAEDVLAFLEVAHPDLILTETSSPERTGSSCSERSSEPRRRTPCRSSCSPRRRTRW